MKEQSKQQAASVEAYQANVSRKRGMTRRKEGDTYGEQRDSGSSSRENNTQALPASTRASLKDTWLAETASLRPKNELPTDSGWKMKSDGRETVRFLQCVESILPNTEHTCSVALHISLGSMSDFLQDEHSGLIEPIQVPQILTVTGSRQIA